MYYDYIQISKINDFTFCPRSLYFHSVYESFDKTQYKARPQIAGTIAHKSVEEGKFSSRKNILQGMEVFSAQYGIIGKIDIYDTKKQELIERKRMIKKIYNGYLFQLYAQKLCLEEMGYPVKKMKLYSLVDNRVYPVEIGEKQKELFWQTLSEIRSFSFHKNTNVSKAKCSACIYRELCRQESGATPQNVAVNF